MYNQIVDKKFYGEDLVARGNFLLFTFSSPFTPSRGGYVSQ
jgi:hypothetical protein